MPLTIHQIHSKAEAKASAAGRYAMAHPPERESADSSRKENNGRTGQLLYSFKRMPEEREISLASLSSDRARFKLRMEVPAISANTSFV